MAIARTFVAAGVLAAACAGCAGGGSAADQTEAEPLTVYESERWRIAGQPQPADYQREAEDGTVLVINLRTEDEIGDLDFDPRAEVESRGMRYVHIPLGGDDGYEPADVDAFAAAVAQADGPVLVHCASGGRARTMWTAYLVEREGVPVEAAIKRTYDVGGRHSSLERLLGREVHYTLGDPLPPEDDEAEGN